MTYRLFLLTLLTCFAVNSFGFEHIRCYTDQYLNSKKEENPEFEKAYNQTFDYIYEMARHQRDMEDSAIYRIPVVVHVVYKTSEQNIPDSLIYNQIEVLNQDFRRQNPDTSKTREIFKPYAGDAGIEFFLAETDPDGNPTTGITRTETTEETFMDFADFDKVKSDSTGGIFAWPTDQYLNIWVCNLNFVLAGMEIPGVLGFAYPPMGAPNWPAEQFPDDPDLAGVVVHFQVFGRNNPGATGELEAVSRGRTATHEIGHFLGLRHIWGDAGFGQDGCQEDDGIEDTPNQAQASQQTCDLNRNSCVISPVNYPDMIENYMDYSDERCMNMFTHGQIAVMRMVLRELRPGLAEVENVTSVNEADNDMQIRVYPNPVSDHLYLSFSKLQKVDRVTITDVKGRTALVENYNGQTYQKLKIGTNHLADGIYFLSIESEGIQSVNRFVVKN